MKELPTLVTSAQNPKVKEAAKLQNRRHRNQTGHFLIEGYRELLRACEGGVEVIRLFICPELFLGENEQSLIDRIQAEVIVCSPSIFQKLSYRDRPDGLLAVAVQMKTSLFDLETTDASLFVVAEAIEKPGNLGSILRSADGVNADGVIVCDRCTDIYNPNVVRASVGTLFTQPVVEASTEELFTWLKEKGITIVATSPAAKATYTDVDLTGSIAIAVGTEQLGLSDRWLDEADLKVSIPMRGSADSLNVATATTLLLYEVLRQR